MQKKIVFVVLLLIIVWVITHFALSKGEKKSTESATPVSEQTPITAVDHGAKPISPAPEEVAASTNPLLASLWVFDRPLDGKAVDYYSLEFESDGKFISCHSGTIITEKSYPEKKATLKTVAPTAPSKNGCYDGTYVQSDDETLNLSSSVNVATPDSMGTSATLTAVKISTTGKDSVLSFVMGGKTYDYTQPQPDLTGRVWIHDTPNSGHYSMEFRTNGKISTCFSPSSITKENYSQLKKTSPVNKGLDLTSDSCYEGIYYTHNKKRGTFDMEGGYGLLIPFWTKVGTRIVVVSVSNNTLSFKPVGSPTRTYKAL